MEQGTATTTDTTLIYKWIMFSAAITGMGLAATFWPIWGNIPLIVIPSLLVLLLGKPVFFERLKLWTLVAMRVLIILAALNLFGRQRYVNIVLWMLAVNILEATLTDLLRHKQVLNAISGFAVAIGVFVLSGTWVSTAPFGQFYIVNGATFAITAAYVLAYTIWNWIFVSYEFSPSISFMHIGFLLAPIIGCVLTGWLGALGGIGFWLVMRANTLSIGGWMQIGNKAWFEREYHWPKLAAFIEWVHQKPVQIVLMLINVALIGFAIAMALKTGSFVLPRVFSL